MERHELMAKLEEIQNSNYATFKGSNEADLHTREDIADLFKMLSQGTAEITFTEKEVIDLFHKSKQTGLTAEYLLIALKEKKALEKPGAMQEYTFEQVKKAIEFSHQDYKGFDEDTLKDYLNTKQP